MSSDFTTPAINIAPGIVTEAASAATRRTIAVMTDAERHAWLEFIHSWLAGKFMGKRDQTTLARWRRFAALFPPRVPTQIRLYRLVTVPIATARREQFTFKPAPGPVSSWTRTLVGLDAVAGIAHDFRDSPRTARVGIVATIPGNLVLATPVSIRDAFMAMSHDYFARYPETEVTRPDAEGRLIHSVIWPGYPGGPNAKFSMDEIGFLRDVLNRPGGHCRQYEYVVETPAQVVATVVQVYRVGHDTVRVGNDDPHQGPPPRVSQRRFA